MNVYDSLLAQKMLESADAQKVTEPGEADLILLNTCAIRENAHTKIYNRLRELQRFHTRGAKVGVLGCMAQNLKEDLLYEDLPVDFIMGPDAYRKLPQMLSGKTEPNQSFVQLSRTETYDDIIPTIEHHLQGQNNKFTASVTIQRGCDNFCAFCVVPQTRGRERSRPAESITDEIQVLAESGIKTVILLGQNVNSYKTDKTDFTGLIRAILDKTNVERIYFSSPHPKDFPESLIELMATEPRFCNQVHMPLQAGSDTVLRRMKRNYTSKEFLALVEKFRQRVPDVAISTDVIMGFPGETNEEFEQTFQVMQQADFDNAFMFAYSARKGTIASRLYTDDVPNDVKQSRLAKIIAAQLERSMRKNAAYIGKKTEILVESVSKRSETDLAGRMRNGRKVIFSIPENTQVDAYLGKKMTILIESVTSQVLKGKLLQ